MRTIIFVAIILISVVLNGQTPKSSPSEPASKMTPPPKAEVKIVVDDSHGHKISDPYRWLEDAGSKETQGFVAEQNAYTQQMQDSLPVREQLRGRIQQLLNIGRVEAPRPAGSYYFYEKREGQQNQPAIYVREGLNGKDRTLVDVNQLAPDGTVALDWWHPSHDGNYVAYGTSPNGSEISTLRVIETATGKLLPEQIWRTRAASV